MLQKQGFFRLETSQLILIIFQEKLEAPVLKNPNEAPAVCIYISEHDIKIHFYRL